MPERDLVFLSALAATRLRDLDPSDVEFLREAHERLQQPLPVPSGFRPTTPPACLPALFAEEP